MTTALAIGVGVATAAFLASILLAKYISQLIHDSTQGRAGLVAFRKYRGGAAGAAALGKSYYKGGFESKMSRREAALILQLK